MISTHTVSADKIYTYEVHTTIYTHTIPAAVHAQPAVKPQTAHLHGVKHQMRASPTQILDPTLSVHFNDQEEISHSGRIPGH